MHYLIEPSCIINVARCSEMISGDPPRAQLRLSFSGNRRCAFLRASEARLAMFRPVMKEEPRRLSEDETLIARAERAGVDAGWRFALTERLLRARSSLRRLRHNHEQRRQRSQHRDAPGEIVVPRRSSEPSR